MVQQKQEAIDNIQNNQSTYKQAINSQREKIEELEKNLKEINEEMSDGKEKNQEEIQKVKTAIETIAHFHEEEVKNEAMDIDSNLLIPREFCDFLIIEKNKNPEPQLRSLLQNLRAN